MTSVVLLSFLIILCSVHINQVSANTNTRNNEFAGVERVRRADNYYQPAAARKPQYEELIDQYEPASRATAAQTYSSSVADPSEYSGQSYSQPQPASYRQRSQYPKQTYGGSSGGNSKLDAEAAAEAAAKEEEEKKPDRLALLLADSKFTCPASKDGYYADETVGCQVFHYCVSGVKHSWQCPENTVFHQIHLNCVPSAQDICKQSSKYHVVNDYLYKQLDQRGPNNTIRYHQRFYPEGFSLGDPLLAPGGQPASYGYDSDSYEDPRDSRDSRGQSQSQSQSYRPSSYQSYPASPPVRPAQRAVYKQQTAARPAYNPPSYSTQSLPAETPTKRPTYSTYSTPNAYPTSDYNSDGDYASPGSSYTNLRDSDFSSSVYSAPSTSYPPSSGQSSGQSSYGGSNSYSPSLSNYQSASPSLQSSGVSSYSQQYKPSQSQSSKPASYNRQIGIPIASFRVAASPNYGSSPQASRIRSAAYASPSGFSIADFVSGVKYDEDY